MKRILYAILATVSGLVLLFSYRTSLGESVVSDVAAVSGNTTSVAPAPVASGASGTSTPAPTSSATATVRVRARAALEATLSQRDRA